MEFEPNVKLTDNDTREILKKVKDAFESTNYPVYSIETISSRYIMVDLKTVHTRWGDIVTDKLNSLGLQIISYDGNIYGKSRFWIAPLP